MESSGKSPIVQLISFGFRYGEPERAHIVDARSIWNPHKRRKFRSKTGMDFEVRQAIMSHSPQAVREVLDQAIHLIIDHPDETIAVGCNSGKHRSVFVAEILGRIMKVKPIHRDINTNTEIKP